MGALYLVRHGQASFGAADYDQLSELGARQCRRLGEHWQRRGMRFDAAFSGTLRRQRQSLAAIGEALTAHTKLKGLVEIAGSLPDDGKVIDDLRDYSK